MADCKPATTPAEKDLQLQRENDTTQTDFSYRQAVGSLIYLTTATRPDIAWTVSRLSQFLDRYGPAHVATMKRLLRYLQGTKHYKLKYSPGNSQLVGYCDSDWAGDAETRRSTSGYLFKMGSAPISWRSKKQTTVALSSCEAEFMALAEGTKEMIYLRAFCNEIGLPQPPKTTMYCDNQSAMVLMTKRPGQMNRTKHINVRYNFIKERDHVNYCYIPIDDNAADILTKSVGRVRHQHLLKYINIDIEGEC
ncbi:uncharacterized protein [Watersipora subatra]|uniref:uncharacterized protein n=1 Tax=Watersipora subatra TaxID=2589382 RepID=UPI00355C1F4A